MVLFDADYPYPKVYSDFCYQKSIQAILSGVLLEVDDWMVWKYYNTIPLKMLSQSSFSIVRTRSFPERMSGEF